MKLKLQILAAFVIFMTFELLIDKASEVRSFYSVKSPIGI
jgi:hypothetical protein